MSNCLVVFVLIFIDFTYLLKFLAKPTAFSSVSQYWEILRNPHTPTAEAASI